MATNKSNKTNDTSKIRSDRFNWKKGDVQIYDSVEVCRKANAKNKSKKSK